MMACRTYSGYPSGRTRRRGKSWSNGEPIPGVKMCATPCGITVERMPTTGDLLSSAARRGKNVDTARRSLPTLARRWSDVELRAQPVRHPENDYAIRAWSSSEYRAAELPQARWHLCGACHNRLFYGSRRTAAHEGGHQTEEAMKGRTALAVGMVVR